MIVCKLFDDDGPQKTCSRFKNAVAMSVRRFRMIDSREIVRDHTQAHA
jgi:hypothetical protein